jgi:hypothetical protein
MATFQITGPDGKKYRVSGETAEGALSALQQHLGSAQREENPNEGLPYGQPPEGMVLNPQTGQMEDLRSSANPNIPDGGAAALGLGVGQGVGFNLLDEAVAGASALTGGDYDYDLGRMREAERRAAEEHPGKYYGGQVGGALGGGLGIAGLGGSLAANSANAGGTLGRIAMGSAADGAIMGAAHGFGAGEGVEGRAIGAGLGGVGGLAAGAIAPYAIAGLQAAARPFLSPLLSRANPDAYAGRALDAGVRRSGMTIDDIANSLSRAQADDQGMFTVADAMGNSGQRMLSTVTRNPNDMRQTVVDMLTGRQMGQGDRLSSFLAEGFDAADTAAQRAARLTAERTATANTNYGAARAGAGNVDPTRAIAAADDFLGMGSTLPRTNIADDSIESAVSRARSYLTDGNSVLTDFSTALRSKQEMDAMIEGATPAIQRQLIPIRNALDEALEGASPQYAAARDAFRQQSRAIDAVDTGRAASSGRMRSADTIPQFGRMTPEEQAAFRAGYADPLIARVESTSMSPTTNKARPLITPKTGEEFPAFAAQGRGEQLGNRISREQRMFETAQHSLGGSKTADNIADAAELAKFDPGIMMKLFNGRPIAAAMEAAGRLVNEAGGMSPGVTERIAQALIETNPAAARQFLDRGAQTAAQNELRRAIAAMITGQAGGATTGRLNAGKRPLEITVTPRR